MSAVAETRVFLRVKRPEFEPATKEQKAHGRARHSKGEAHRNLNWKKELMDGGTEHLKFCVTQPLIGDIGIEQLHAVTSTIR